MFASRSASVIAVTGGGGFVGSHLLRALTAKGWDCHVFAPDEAGRDRFGDLTPLPTWVNCPTPESLALSVAELDPDVVVHLGAIVSTQRTLEKLRETIRWNLLGTISLFESLVGKRVRRVVQLGSCEEYGRGEGPFSENMSLDPVSPYSASKAAASCYARMFFNSFGLPVTVLRPSVVYGPGQMPAMLIPEVITSLLRGSPVDTTEGTQTRDFLFIDDLVDAILSAATAPGVEGRIFNIGSGEPVTLRACIGLIEELTGRRGMVRYGAKPFSQAEIFDYSVDIRQAMQELKWKPRVSLRTGLKITIDSYAAAMSNSNDEMTVE